MTRDAIHRLRGRCRGLSVGILAADPGGLRAAAHAVSSWGGGMLHFDVMDGVFVPAITAGPAFVRALDIGLVRDVHLMVDNPAAQVPAFVDAGADIITVHAEAEGADTALAAIRDASAQLPRPILAGLALMPETSLAEVEPLLAKLPDLVLVLAVDPRRGKAFDIAGACAKILALADRLGARPLLAFDGGVTEATIAEIAACRPDMVISGTAVFAAADCFAAFMRLDAAIAERRFNGNGDDAHR